MPLQEALWLEASLYVLYENLAKAAQLSGDHAQYVQYMSKCLRLVGIANPGSDQHVQMAAK